MLGITNITITPEILNQISDINEFKGLWAGLEQHTTSLHMLGDVSDYGSSFDALLQPLKTHDITPHIIQALHKAHFAKDTTAGQYRTANTAIEITQKNQTVGILETSEPEDISALLEKLCTWLNDSLNTENKTPQNLHPLLITAIFVAIFVQIAPFEKGNLRILRLLIMLIMLKSGYLYAPYISLAPIMDDNAHSIFKTLKSNQSSLNAGHPKWEDWISCFLNILQDQKNALQTRINTDTQTVESMPALSLKIMNVFKTHKRLQINEIITLTKGRRATIKLRLTELLESGHLKRHGKARATWYSLT